MVWTAGDYARLGSSVALLFAAVAFIEHRRAVGKPVRETASFCGVVQTIGVGLLLVTFISAGLYAWTGSAESALSIGGIGIGVVILGGLRGVFSEYQLTRGGPKFRNKKE